MYDKDFRIHRSKHPLRNWSIILQQAWALRLRDKPAHLVSNAAHPSYTNNNQNNTTPKKFEEPCRRYNKGRCPFGSGCHFEHRCSYCFKLGHSILTCRKLLADLEREKSRHNRKDKDHRSFRDFDDKKFNDNDLNKKGHGNHPKMH